jgi:hypothetical protein
VLDPHVLALRVLADDDDVDVVVARNDAVERTGRSHVGEQVQFLTQLDVHAAVAAVHGGRERSFEAKTVLLDRRHRRGRQRRPRSRDGGGAGLRGLPLDRRASRLDETHGGVDHFRADPITTNQGHSGSHGRSP